MAEPRQHLVHVGVLAVPEEIGIRQAAAVRQEIPHGHRLADPGIVNLELGDVPAHRVVPTQLPLVHEDAERRGGHGLGGRADREQGVSVHRLGFSEFKRAVAAGEQQFLPPDDGDRETGRVPVGDRPLDVVVEFTGVELLECRDRSRPRHRGEQQGRRTSGARAGDHQELHPSS